jgi:cytochrome c
MNDCQKVIAPVKMVSTRPGSKAWNIYTTGHGLTAATYKLGDFAKNAITCLGCHLVSKNL